MPAKKRKKISDELRLAPGISMRSLQDLLGQLNKADSSYSTLKADFGARVSLDTPYGKLLDVMEVETVEGPPLQWHFCNPLALMHVLCQQAPAFAKLLRSVKKGCPGHKIAMYSDETTPGNAMNPDTPKDIQCFYWTFHELPHWFRNRLWFTFSVMRTSEEDTCKGGLSGVMRKVMRSFFGEAGHSFKTGVRLSDGQGGLFHLRAIMGALVQDEKAFKKVWSVKGASGWRCCLACKNVLNCDPAKIADDPYLRHVATAMPHEFDLQSDEEFWQACDHLQAEFHRWQAGLMTKTAFGDLEKAMGLTYDPDSLAYDMHLRTIIGISSTYFDWMHCLVASSGLAQFEVNAFCLALLDNFPDVTLNDLDVFALQINFSSGSFPKHFFENRIVMTEGKHMKAFASETINAVEVLALFAEMVLIPNDPEKTMLEHCSSMQMLKGILDTLRDAKRNHMNTVELQKQIVEHHRKALQVYGEGIFKIKPHLLMHVPGQMDWHDVFLDCFPTERQHHITKLIVGIPKGDSLVKKSMIRILNHILDEFCSPDMCQETRLLKPAMEAPLLAPACAAILGESPVNEAPKVSRSIRTELGIMRHRELLCFSSNGSATLGVAQFFVAHSAIGGRYLHLACIAECVRASTHEWVPSQNVSFLDMRALSARLSYAQSGEALRPIVPTPFQSLFF